MPGTKHPKRFADLLIGDNNPLSSTLLGESDEGDSLSSENRTLGIDQLRRGRYQPRHPSKEDDIEELAQSIRQVGVIQPIVVRPLDGDTYEVVAGDRRWRAAQRAGLDRVPVIIRHIDDKTAAQIALIENLQRRDLNPIEEAQGLQRLVDEFGLSQRDVAEVVGKSISAVSRTLGLLELDPLVQAHIQEGRLESGHGKVILGLSRSNQVQLAEQAIRKGWSVRELEKQKGTLLRNQDTQKGRSAPRRDPDIVRLETGIQEWLGAPVMFKYSSASGKGRIEINFNSLDECNGILEKIGYRSDDSEYQGKD